MFKKEFSLLILLLFIVMPTSFAVDDNLSFETNDTILSENELDEIHVDVNGNDNNQGDLQHPFLTIGHAINVSSNNSKIIVHEGVYKENNLNINKSIEIDGQGNVIIDAEMKNRIFTINAPDSNKIVLSGITFINGNSMQMAGAIYVLKATTVIDNCKFINNTAATEGGAIYWNGANGRLTNSLIENNYARDGSGVKWGESDTSLSLGEADYGQIVNCTFDNNHIMQDEDACIGLTIYSNHVKVINSKFINHKTNFNSSFEVLYINGDYGSVENCLFANNEMTLTGALGLDGNYAKVIGNRFINNTVSFPDAFGGALGIQSETGTIYNNTFINNGGSACAGGAIFINIMEDHQFSFINITNNIFENNFAIVGGDVYANGQNCPLSLRINNNIFKNSKSENGSAIYIVDIYDPVIINNNTFKNLIADYGAGIYTPSCIIDISKNLMYNCTSIYSENIYSNNEIKGKLKLKFNNVTGAINRTIVLSAILSDDEGNFISTNKINFKINNETLIGKKGINNFTTTFNKLGNYTINGNYEYGAITESGILNILCGANLQLDNITNYGTKVAVKINLTDDYGNPIKGSEIFLNVNNNTFLLITKEDGTSETTIDFDFGNHEITAMFVDNKYYASVNTTSSITVVSSIVSADITRAYNSGYDFKAQLFNFNGSLLKNTKVIFQVNNNKYEVFTDLNGIAILNNKLSPGFYFIIVLNPITGEKTFNNVNIVKRIVENNNLNIYFGSNSYYKIKLVGDNGKFVGAGEIVKITVNGVTHSVKTDKNGYASLKINLKANKYTITATYKGYKVSNKITIKPVLTAKNISKKKAKKIKFTAKIVNTKGKPIKGKKITFKIKGKTYKIKTNKKGIATLTLKNLKIGKYKITSKYGKSTIKNTIKIKR